MADDSGINFGPGPAGKEFPPIPFSEISDLSLTEATQLLYTQAPVENARFSQSHAGVQDLSRAGIYKPAGT